MSQIRGDNILTVFNSTITAIATLRFVYLIVLRNSNLFHILDKMTPQLDQLDYSILALLQHNAKITNVQLAETIGLSPAATLERVKRLETQDIIHSYLTQLNQHKLGLQINVWLQICLHNLTPASIQSFKQAIDQLPEVVACYHVIGEVDFLLNVLTTELPTYQALLVNKLSKIEAIKHIRTMTVLATLKETGIPMSHLQPSLQNG